jgi:hypothetical protein
MCILTGDLLCRWCMTRCGRPTSCGGVTAPEECVWFNSVGGKGADPVAAKCRAAPEVCFTGLFSQASLFHHSWYPNARHLPIGNCLVVRVARPMSATAEVTIAYLGDQVLEPLASRLEACRSVQVHLVHQAGTAADTSSCRVEPSACSCDWCARTRRCNCCHVVAVCATGGRCRSELRSV